MIVLGIDPGSIVCGYGVISKNGNMFKLIEYGVIHAKKKDELLPYRLKEIYTRLNKVIERTNPEYSAFESMFYSKNPQSLIKLTHARAVAVLSAAMYDLPIFEYSPREVKKSVTGNGNASKEQVQFMVRTLLNISETPEFFDATDALAVAICHAQRCNGLNKSSSSWAEFIKQNPDRIVKE